MSLANPEEATNIANEYISSIENLPNEVQFLLGEIKRKDEQVADIEAKALKKSNDLFGRRTNGSLTPREQTGIEKIREYLERIAKLNEEKIQLSLDLQRISSRAVGRLDYDLNRIRRATGDLPPEIPPIQPIPPSQSFRVTQAVTVAQVAATNINISAPAAPPAIPAYTPQLPVQVPEAVVAPPPVAPLSAQKRRRLNASASVLSNPPNTAPVALTPTPSVRARPTPQAQTHAPSPAPAPRKRDAARAAPVEFDVDEEEEDAPPDEEDNNPYCYCHQPSHGEMVACDGANCPYEWFHLACLGLKHAPKNSKWYCSECTPSDRGGDADPQLPEKGRKRR